MGPRTVDQQREDIRIGAVHFYYKNGSLSAHCRRHQWMILYVPTYIFRLRFFLKQMEIGWTIDREGVLTFYLTCQPPQNNNFSGDFSLQKSRKSDATKWHSCEAFCFRSLLHWANNNPPEHSDTDALLHHQFGVLTIFFINISSELCLSLSLPQNFQLPPIFIDVPFPFTIQSN